jgi:hypothetical protein
MTAESVEFARAAGAEESISAPLKHGERVVRFSLHHRPFRLLIIAGGGSKSPPRVPTPECVLRLPRDPSRTLRVTMTVIPLMADTTVQFTAAPPQPFRLGAVDTPQPIEITLPATGAASTIVEQELRFTVDKVDKWGRGIAIQKIELEVGTP